MLLIIPNTYPIIRHPQESRYGLFTNGSSRLWSYGVHSNPTAYGFGHLFTVHGLYYWKRDLAIVQRRMKSDPCFANIRNIWDIYNADGSSSTVQSLLAALRWAAHNIPGLHDLTDCLVQSPQPPFSVLGSAEVLSFATVE